MQKKEQKLRYYRIILSLFLFTCITFFCSGSTIEPFIIKPERRINYYNNKGLLYLEDGFYFAAITSFKIALGINPNSAASAPTYDNLGKAYLKTDEPQMAQECFEAAILFSPNNFQYYFNLVQSYKNQNILEKKLTTKNYRVEESYKPIVTGLILIALGEEREGKKILKNFANKEPAMIISKQISVFLESHISDL